MVRWRGRVPATPAGAGVLRGEMEAIALQCGLSPERAKDVKLAVSEAVTNAVQHAYRDREPGYVWGIAHIEEERLRIVIADSGIGMTPRTDSPGLGLGLPLISQLADSIQVRTAEDGTEIHMSFPCPSAGAPVGVAADSG
jgi:serine/threonine-protein kinase RsbW/stage II sporulation protein AB (anti-sigma F factor)